MTLEELYYFHAFLNYKLFKGKLEPVIIRIFDDDFEVSAQIETELDPFIIFMGKSLLESEPVFTITVLLHEMVHQYNRQRGAEDVEAYTGEHNAVFKRVARSHGLQMDGYKLTDETRALIEKQLELYKLMIDSYKSPIL